jgi:broad specificity phosphatase PhoE
VEKGFFSGLPEPLTFIIMRHGESQGNAEGILQGRGEYPLSQKGRNQALKKARILAELIEDIPVEKRILFSSPQSRARETAEIVAENNSFPQTVFLEDLREMDLGEWTGATWSGVNGGEGKDAWDSFRQKSWDAVPGAESSAELFDRALRVWKQMRDEAVKRKSTLAVTVSHGGLIQWLLKTTMDCRSWFPLFPIHNCGLFIFQVEPGRDAQESYMVWKLIDG